MHLKKSKICIRGYTQHTVKPLGVVEYDCTVGSKTEKLPFHVVDIPGAEPILGNTSCSLLGLVKRTHPDESKNVDALSLKDIHKYYPEIVNDDRQSMGKMSKLFQKGFHVNTKQGVPGVVHGPRRVPHALKGKVKHTLDYMCDLDVLAEQRQPTEWVSSMVTVCKGDKVRICLDPTDLNEVILREHYPSPTVEEVAAEIANSDQGDSSDKKKKKKKKFSVLDARHGYWQIPLDYESSLLTTFNTPFGRYRYKRLPFGLKCSSDIMQRAMEDVLRGLPGCRAICDDILVWGDDDEEHDRNLLAVLDRAKEYGLKFGASKLNISQPEVKYVGHIFSQEGLKPNPERIRAITDMPVPASKPEVQRFFFMVNYLAKFVPNLANIAAPVRELMKDGVPFVWGDEQQQSYDQLVKIITSSPVLQYYDVNAPVLLTVDASKDGLGACIIQDQKPVGYASRAMTQAQQVGYAQLEKELLAVVFGCERFHQYIYGKTVDVETDHKPLVSLFKKNLSQMSPRVQNMMLKLKRYDLRVKYKKGTEMYVADALSRAYLPETPENEKLCDESIDISVVESLPMSDSKLEEFITATEQSKTMQILKNLVINGWPQDIRKIPPEVRPYHTYRDDIVVVNGLLFKSDRVIVPESLRSDTLRKIHSAHLGVVKSKSRARDVLFWPGMAAQIEDLVQKCGICAQHRPNNPKEPLISHPPTSRPWEKIGVDLCTCEDREYLIMVDYFSKYPEVKQLKDQTSKTVINKMKATFAQHGAPDTVMSDNGPQFSAQEFKDFAEEWEFNHVTSSPKHPQSNGQVENMVKSVKRLIKKCAQGNEDPYVGLLELRNTPLIGVNKSPAQLLMGRRLKSVLPTSRKLLEPKLVNREEIKCWQQQSQYTQKKYFDQKSGNTLPKLKEGEKVRVQITDKEWQPAIVKRKLEAPRSYIVQTPEGRAYRRNRKFIRTSKESDHVFQPKPRRLSALPKVLENRQKDRDRNHGNGNDAVLPPGIGNHGNMRNEVVPPSVSSEAAPVSQPVSVPKTVSPETSPSVSQTVTRSGRAVKVPSKMKDYVM